MRTDSLDSSAISINTSKHHYVANNRLLRGIVLTSRAAEKKQILVKEIALTTERDQELLIVKRQKLQAKVATAMVVFLSIAFVYLLIFN